MFDSVRGRRTVEIRVEHHERAEVGSVVAVERPLLGVVAEDLAGDRSLARTAFVLDHLIGDEAGPVARRSAHTQVLVP